MNIRETFINWLLKKSMGKVEIDVKELADVLTAEGIHRDHAVRIAMKITQGK